MGESRSSASTQSFRDKIFGMTSSWAARGATFLAELPHNAVIAITGDDAVQFLHGQFTNDVEALRDGEAQWNGWCTAKGRLVASFLLVRTRGSFLLMLPAEIAPAFQKRLSMYVLRSKVKLADDSARIACLGIAGPDAAPAARALPESTAARLDDRHYVVFVPREKLQEARNALVAQDVEPASEQAWDWSLIRAGIPTIVGATQEAFVPQMVNFDLIDAVSFRKGCYPGQEIVARTQYRGALKRRMALAHVDGGECPQPGESVYSAAFGDQAAGIVANAAPAPDGGCDLLVVAQVESLERGDLRLKSPGGPALTILFRPHAPAGELAS